jgi:hypothetical protein
MTRFMILAVAAMLAGCDGVAASAGATQDAGCAAQPGVPAVPTMAFRDFLATRPTPAEFRARYPHMTLVMPGDITTRELRLDCSRFFADTDIDGRVVAGRFG